MEIPGFDEAFRRVDANGNIMTRDEAILAFVVSQESGCKCHALRTCENCLLSVLKRKIVAQREEIDAIKKQLDSAEERIKNHRVD